MTNETASGMGNTSIGIEKKEFLLAPAKNKTKQHMSRPSQKRYLIVANLLGIQFLTFG